MTPTPDVLEQVYTTVRHAELAAAMFTAANPDDADHRIAARYDEAARWLRSLIEQHRVQVGRVVGAEVGG